jgi:hypothetical protein
MGSFHPTKLRPGDYRDILAAKFEIKNTETYNMKDLYRFMVEYLIDNNWVAADDGGKCPEIFYHEQRIKPERRNHLMWWRIVKLMDGGGKRSRYYQCFLRIDFEAVAVKDTQVMHGNKKFKTHKGAMVVRIESWLQLDFRNEWEKHPILKHFQKYFIKRFYMKDWKRQKEDLYKETYDLGNFIKKYFTYTTTKEIGRSFHPETGAADY